MVDANTHPTQATSDMNERTRKIGLGVMGWADLLYQLNLSYTSEKALKLADDIGNTLQSTADKFSESLGREYPEVWENRDEWYKLCGFRYGKSKRKYSNTA